jgi:four helix bundle protein
MRRAAVSIASNIAEGSPRSGDADFRRFLVIAEGSASELDTQTILARDFGYIRPDTARDLQTDIDRCQTMLARLVQRLSLESIDVDGVRSAVYGLHSASSTLHRGSSPHRSS